MLIDRNAARAATRGGVLLEERPTPSAKIQAQSLGLLPSLSLTSAVGFVLVAGAFYASRRQVPLSEIAYWVGIGLLAVPVLVRLLSRTASRPERVGLVVILTVGLYLVKVAYSPLAFTFPDEFAHELNVVQVLQTGHLFQANPIITVTSVYPGLVDVTTAIASTTGLSPFVSGIVVIGAARLLLALSLFVLIERTTRSARLAGLAVGLYTANPNYLFFSAEYAYESLALPLSCLALYAVLRRDQVSGLAPRRAWTAVAGALALSVVVTHHLTSYALVAALWGMVLVARYKRANARPAPWDLALATTIAVVAWFAFIASSTGLYLASALGGAFLSLFALVTFQQAPRQVFDPSGAFGGTPVWQELIALASIVFIVVALPFGLLHVWRYFRRYSFALVLGIAAALYVPVQVLRLTPASWETGNRASEFLFIGVGLVVAVALGALDEQLRSRLARLSLPIYVSVVFLGGVVISWRPDLRLPRAYITEAAGQVIQPEGVTVAQLMRQSLGPNNNIPTDESNAMLLGLYGRQYSSSGPAGGVRRMLLTPTLDPGAIGALVTVNAQYVVMDRRVQSGDHLVGIYPLLPFQSNAPSQFIDPQAIAKFTSDPDVSRIADSGDILVFDVSKLVAKRGNP